MSLSLRTALRAVPIPSAILAAAVLAIAPAQSAALVPFTESGPPVAGAALSGVHERAGYYAYNEFAAWRGSPVRVVVDFMGCNTWSSIENSATWLAGQHQGLKAHFVLSMPMIPAGRDATGKPLADLYRAASRYYDGHYQQIARNLVAAGYGRATIRLGWEQTGDWFVWGNRTWGTRPDGVAVRNRDYYATAWRVIWRAMEAVNPGFTWDFNISDQHIDPTPWWPGDAYVDYVGGDFYDLGTWDALWNHTASINAELHGAYMADYVANLARTKHKGLALTEWGLVWKSPTHRSYTWSGGDDPQYVQAMWNWTRANRDVLAWEAYFDYADDPATHSDVLYRDGHFPVASALYRSLW